MERANVSRETFRTAFVLLLVLAVTILFLLVTWPFLNPLLVCGLFLTVWDIYGATFAQPRGEGNQEADESLKRVLTARKRSGENRCGSCFPGFSLV
ncbi:MAG: hypothetical protein ACR2II_06095 [Chthoniobacterales bacterium]